MQKTVFILLSLLLATVAVIAPQQESLAALPSAPLPPDTGIPATTTTAVVEPAVPAAPDLPARLIIPSISLNDTISKVGTNDKGEMDVPPGNTTNVGWYQFGTVPGNVGSAVIDAHVFAAFSKLRNLSVGSSIYIQTESGQKLHFVVSEAKQYALADVPADLLFNRSDQARLNLITCAGKLTPDHSTYDHRLVVYATLVQ